mmetsp:Transcript_55477/g.179921  ORF Transcript_55477/g.179921 Transcript_55477/m.179921 type:complete len:511 (+) Transcript_55477:65-1597(+)
MASASIFHGTSWPCTACRTQIFRWTAFWLAASFLVVVGADEITLLVRSQDTAYDRARLSQLHAVVAEAGWPASSVVGMAEAALELRHSGLWTYKPWIFQLEEQVQKARRRLAGGQRWFVFLEPATKLDPKRLAAALAEHDAREEVFVGRVLQDQTSSIIHHYSTSQTYPQALTGFALSAALMKALAQELRDKPLGGNQQIEPVWELAKWIEDTRGVKLTDRGDTFCADMQDGCATWVAHDPRPSWKLLPDDVVIGVKTVAKFHASRIPLIHDFWSKKSTVEVLFLSNAPYSGVVGARVVDLTPQFGSMVDPAKEATKEGSGHCSKMHAIVGHLARHVPGKRWYVVTDDDTLLNVPRLLEVLASHDDREAVYVGERYGWAHRERLPGTNYITTGGGMAISGPALQQLNDCHHCTCTRPDSPDDMMLGSWFTSLEVTIVHETGFHQSEPHNYHPEVLRLSEPPVSFHRYNLQLPGSASEEERAKGRRKNWRQWKELYFQEAGASRSGGADEL